jgi:hypothetical protein
VISNKDNEGVVAEVRGEVNELMSKFPLFKMEELVMD